MKKIIFLILFAAFILLLIPIMKDPLQEKKNYILTTSRLEQDKLEDLFLLKKSPIKGALNNYSFSDERFPYSIEYTDEYYDKKQLESFSIEVIITKHFDTGYSSPPEQIEYRGLNGYYFFQANYYDHSEEPYNFEQLLLFKENAIYHITSIMKSDLPKDKSLNKLLAFLDENLVSYNDI